MAKCSIETCMETKGIVMYGPAKESYCRNHWQLRWHAEQMAQGIRVMCRECLPSSQKHRNADLANTELCPVCGIQKQLYYSPP